VEVIDSTNLTNAFRSTNQMFKKTVLMGITVLVLCALTQNSAFACRRACSNNYPATGYYYPTTGYSYPTTGYNYPTSGYYYPTTGYSYPTTGYYYPTTGVYNTAAVSGSSSTAGFSFWPFLLPILESELGNLNLGGNLGLKTLIQTILNELNSQQGNTNSSLLTAKKAPSDQTEPQKQIQQTGKTVDGVLQKLGLPIPSYPNLATP
jgi:hypothetical protein